MAITLTLTRVLGKLFGYIKQPQVIGEIVAGILLGPSVLGQIPGAWLLWGTATSPHGLCRQRRQWPSPRLMARSQPANIAHDKQQHDDCTAQQHDSRRMLAFFTPLPLVCLLAPLTPA